MNTGNLKSYAPQARKDFIAAVTARANLLGLSEHKDAFKVMEAEVKYEVATIAGRPWPVKVNEQRNKLIQRIKLTSFAQTMESAAYAWFNRLAALRFMELHDYLGHGRRVLSNPAGGLPEVLTHALDLAAAGALPGLLPEKVRELKLANQDAELYRQVLIAQCNALHTAMPFLFEAIGDETELLLPENLLLTDSVVAKLVQSIPEDDWKEIEIIGWLYQFYISEKKDQVIGKVVKSEDIPAATQLFTPNWIVKYMVQNSLGAQWLATYPDSPIKAQMEYYIEPAEQTDEVNAQLAAITPSNLDPEAITLMDPACGSGHILVEAYELFKAIYLERGYRLRDVAQLILEKNIFGLDIDERAAQLTGFALMMKARADDRRLFERGVKLNVMALRDSTGFDVERLVESVKLADYGLTMADLTVLKEPFEHATTFGSLIQLPVGLAANLPALKRLSEMTSHDFFVSDILGRFAPLVQQASLLATQYDTVVANPPYMSGAGMNSVVKKFTKSYFPGAKNDLFACFIERGYTLGKEGGRSSMVTMQSWMFLSSFEKLRERLLREKTITTMTQIGYNSFPSMNSKVAQAVVFSTANIRLGNFTGTFTNLNSAPQAADKNAVFLVRDPKSRFEVASDEFRKIRGSPLAYWLSDHFRQLFVTHTERLKTNSGLTTGDNERFIRVWWEISAQLLKLATSCRAGSLSAVEKWYPYNKGGDSRRWCGNEELVVNWHQDGSEIRATGRCVLRSKDEYFRPGITWGGLTSSAVSFRLSNVGHLFDSNKGPMIFGTEADLRFRLGMLNSVFSHNVLQSLNPTISTQTGDIERIPAPDFPSIRDSVETLVRKLTGIACSDWDAYERSWHFQSAPFLTASFESSRTLQSSYITWITTNRDTIAEMKRLEEENNRLFIDAYGLADELTPEVLIEEITLTVNPAYRYGGNLSEEEQWARFREDTMQELVSYVVGCIMGRYSLDAPGLIYANASNVGFDASCYKSFPADADGIVPLTEELWFEDDAALRMREFVQVAWGAANLDENMAWLAEGLGQKPSESPDEAIRRYLADKFFKDHLQTYKKRPIYWLLSSGKQGAFQALVYLHRYNAGTLSRLRAEYVVPLTGKMQSRMELLEKDVTASSSTGARNRASKKLEGLRKKHMELLAYDGQLRHYADQRIELDLDDGVKVNYGKFGDLLAEVKAVTGGKGDDE